MQYSLIVFLNTITELCFGLAGSQNHAKTEPSRNHKNLNAIRYKSTLQSVPPWDQDQCYYLIQRRMWLGEGKMDISLPLYYGPHLISSSF